MTRRAGPRMVVLLVDALGWELASGQPGFASGLSHRRKVETILGFSAGALPTVFTGKMPQQHGRWRMYRRSRGSSPFRGFEWLRFLPGSLRRSYRLGRLLHRLVERRGVRGYFHLYEVPRPLLPQFDLAERGDLFAPGGLPLESLWDSLERRGVRWSRWNWRTPESENLAALERRLAEGDVSFLFCYTADLDAALHREGTRGEGVAARMRRYSSWIDRLLEASVRRGEPVWLYLVSDHGMVDVERSVDLMRRVEGLPARVRRDLLAFFDSTMARFWWRSPRARGAVFEALGGAPGRWLSREELDRFGCRFPADDYGEDVFLIDPGVLLLPSYMGSEPVAAMHGYDPSHPDMAAILWSNRPIPDHVGHLLDLRGYFESELDALAVERAAPRNAALAREQAS